MHPHEIKQTILSIKKKKRTGEKISAVTAYDYPTAQVASDAGVDMILVGDSLGMVLQGKPHTLQTTLDEMIYHTRLAASADLLPLLVTDLPFGSYHLNPTQAVESAIRCVKEGGAEAVKLEGGSKRYQAITAILDAEIPVLAHLGLTPQSIHSLGGFRPQGKTKTQADLLVEEAIQLEKLGVFAIILEAIPEELGKQISENISIPTIGIGAGKYCDGQILVFHDLVGFTNLYQPKFVRRYADVYSVIRLALENYISDLRSGTFPGPNETYFSKKDDE